MKRVCGGAEPLPAPLFRIIDSNGKEHPFYSGSYEFPKPDMTIVEVKNGAGKVVGVFPHFAGILLPD